MFDPLLAVFDRIMKKYIPKDYHGKITIDMLAELRRLSYSVQAGTIELDEAKQFLKDFLDTVFGDDVDEDVKNKIIDEVMKAIRVELTRIRMHIPRKGFRFSTTY